MIGGLARPPARWVRVRETDDGMVQVAFQLRPDEAARVLRACDVSAETSDRTDGLVALADAALRGEAAERPPVEVVVHVDAGTLAGNLDDGTGVSAETSRRLLCDAGVVPLLEEEPAMAFDIFGSVPSTRWPLFDIREDRRPGYLRASEVALKIVHVNQDAVDDPRHC